mgnify:FL=1
MKKTKNICFWCNGIIHENDEKENFSFPLKSPLSKETNLFFHRICSINWSKMAVTQIFSNVWEKGIFKKEKN